MKLFIYSKVNWSLCLLAGSVRRISSHILDDLYVNFTCHQILIMYNQIISISVGELSCSACVWNEMTCGGFVN